MTEQQSATQNFRPSGTTRQGKGWNWNTKSTANVNTRCTKTYVLNALNI